MKKQDLKKIKMPDKPGVYFFKKGEQIVYIGKATSLRDRVKSYFSKDLISTRGPIILDMVFQADDIIFETTDSVIEALILEASLIKKYQPKYNTKEKDNKSFNYVCITKLVRRKGGEELPKVLIIRGRNLKKEDYRSVFGPFTNGSQLKEAMKIIRPIFPFIDEQSSKRNNRTFYEQLKLTPDNILQYKNNIKNLKLFFQGKKKSILINMKREMLAFAKKKEFEKAGEMKKRIFALNHINDVALIKSDKNFHNLVSPKIRIEAYDIAHLFGNNMVGVMTVIEDGELAKNEYRKFIIKTQSKSNDIGALEEVFSRRLRHNEWGLPSIIVMDGGIAQVNIAKSVLSRYQFKIPIVSVVKDDKHKAKAIMGDEEIIKKYKKDILLANDESHRFAITFHKKRRGKDFLV